MRSSTGSPEASFSGVATSTSRPASSSATPPLGRKPPWIYVLPRAALRTDSGDDLVYIVDSGDRLRFRTVEVLRARRDDVIVGSGLKPGDRVCISPMAAAINGMAVRVVRAAEAESRLGQQSHSTKDAHELDSAMVQGP